MSTLTRAVLSSVLILGVLLALSILAARTLGPLGLFIAILLPLAGVLYVGRIFKRAILRHTLEKLWTYADSFDGSRFEVESVSRASPEEFRRDYLTEEDGVPTTGQTCWFVAGTFVVGPQAGNMSWTPTLLWLFETPLPAPDFDRQDETHALDEGEADWSQDQEAEGFEDDYDDDDEPLPLVVYAVDRWDGSEWVVADEKMYGSARLRLHVGMQSPLRVGYLTYFDTYLGEIRFPDAG